MAIVQQPCYGVYDERSGETDDRLVAEYQNRAFRFNRLLEFSKFILEKTNEGDLGFDMDFRASIYAGFGLTFIYQNPWVRKQSLPYSVEGSHGELPKPRKLKPGYALLLNNISVHPNENEPPIRVTGPLDDGLAVVTFDHLEDLTMYVGLTKDPTSINTPAHIR